MLLYWEIARLLPAGAVRLLVAEDGGHGAVASTSKVFRLEFEGRKPCDCYWASD